MYTQFISYVWWLEALVISIWCEGIFLPSQIPSRPPNWQLEYSAPYRRTSSLAKASRHFYHWKIRCQVVSLTLVLNFWGYSISMSIANCYSTFNCYTYTTLPWSRMAVLVTPEQFDAGLARESDQGNDALEGDPFGTTPLSGRRLWRVLWLDNEAGLVTLSGSLRLERHENVTFATRG